MEWFSVDRQGLGKLLERRGKEFAIAELLSNSWDQDSTQVIASLQKVDGTRNLYELRVEDDDPTGFDNMAHAYTLFAESIKKDKADKRGRFNLGEKLVLALCESAEIRSTTGGVRFDDRGRHQIREKRAKGSVFIGRLRLTAEEFLDCTHFVRTLIPPPDVVTTFNGEHLQPRQAKASFELPLETHIADAEGLLKRSVRKTLVRVYEPLAGEIPSLYEMGIPVVETNDRWHIDVGQKLPLSFERDNVPPAFLRKLRTEVLNQLYREVTAEDASTTWVKAATESPDAKPEAVKHVLTEIFGPKHVIFDPSDQEANKLAVSQGYAVIHPRSLSAGQWANVRENKLVLPAGQVTPSPKAEFQAAEQGQESDFLPISKWTPGLKNIASFSQAVAKEIGIGQISVRFSTNITANYLAAYGNKTLIYAVGKLGYRWFDDGVREEVISLLVHELAHDVSGDHLSEKYHEALHDLGAKVTMLALQKPHIFAEHGAKMGPAWARLIAAAEVLEAM